MATNTGDKVCSSKTPELTVEAVFVCNSTYGNIMIPPKLILWSASYSETREGSKRLFLTRISISIGCSEWSGLSLVFDNFCAVWCMRLIFSITLCLEAYDETIFVRWVEFNAHVDVAQTPMEYPPLLEVLSQVLWVYLLPELQLWVCFLWIINARRMYIRSRYFRSHVKVCYCGDPFTSH